MEQKDARTIQRELADPSLRRIWSGGCKRPWRTNSEGLLSPT